jgi:LysM repeat protein
MSSIAKTNISLSKKDLTRSRIPPVASRNVVFYHKATLGSSTINLLSLTMPSSQMPNAVQATNAEISGAQLVINKKNLSLVSSSKGPLVQNLDYVVVDSNTISLLSPLYASGAESNEIFVGTINSAPISDLVVASAKTITKTYTLAAGSTILNLGQEYKVGENPNEKVGIIKVYVNGVLAIRGVDYNEVDSGNGYGTTIQFLVAPATIAYSVVVDFGVMAITDNNALGTIQTLAGSIKKIADDLSVVAGTSSTDYYTASPSDIERRTFGDSVLNHEGRITILEAIPPTVNISALDINWNLSNLFTKTVSANSTFTFSNNVDGKTVVVRLINSTAGALTLAWPAAVSGAVTSLSASKTGIYTFIQFGSNIYMTGVEF